MGKYIDRIIEVLDDNNVWKAVVLPRNEMGEKEESIVFGYLSDRNCVSLTAMKLQVGLCIEKCYSRLADSFHERNYQMIIKTLTGEQQQESRFVEDEIDDNPRMEYDSIMEDMQAMIQEISKIETLASYFGGVDDTDRIRVVFFDS